MKITVIGAGGVGGYFGGKLAHAGHDVTFIARGQHLKAIQQNGLTVKSVLGDFTLPNAHATDDINTAGKTDLVLIAVKAWQVKEAAISLRGHLHPHTLVLPLQNGVLATEDLLEGLQGEGRVSGGLCRIFSKIAAPGIIEHFGIEPSIVFGPIDELETKVFTELKTVFAEAGIKAFLSDDITADIWRKFIGICAGGLLAVTKTNYGEMRSLKETRAMMIGLLEEILALSQKIGIKLEADFAAKATAFIDTFPPESTSSLARDIWEGKPSELDYQNGAVVKLAEKYGLDTPINRFVYHCLLPMEIKARAAVK